MTRDQVESKWPQARIEYTEDGQAFVHTGGAYPLVLNVDD